MGANPDGDETVTVSRGTLEFLVDRAEEDYAQCVDAGIIEDSPAFAEHFEQALTEARQALGADDDE